MIFRIMAYGKGKTEAYAEILDHIVLMADSRVYCVYQDGSCSFFQIGRRLCTIHLSLGM